MSLSQLWTWKCDVIETHLIVKTVMNVTITECQWHCDVIASFCNLKTAKNVTVKAWQWHCDIGVKSFLLRTVVNVTKDVLSMTLWRQCHLWITKNRDKCHSRRVGIDIATSSLFRGNKFRDESCETSVQRHHPHLVTKTVMNVLKDNIVKSCVSFVNEIRDECHWWHLGDVVLTSSSTLLNIKPQ
jgi:hypothetical protein